MASDEKIYLSTDWLEATRGTSLECTGLLFQLVLVAAPTGNGVIDVTDSVLERIAKTASERKTVRTWFAELIQHGLVKETEPGRYLIAPGLWALDADVG